MSDDGSKIVHSLEALKERIERGLTSPEVEPPDLGEMYLDNDVYPMTPTTPFLTLNRTEASVVKFAVTYTLQMLRRKE